MVKDHIELMLFWTKKIILHFYVVKNKSSKIDEKKLLVTPVSLEGVQFFSLEAYKNQVL